MNNLIDGSALFSKGQPIEPPNQQKIELDQFKPSEPIEVIAQPVIGTEFISEHLRELTTFKDGHGDVATNLDESQVEVSELHSGTIMFSKDESWIAFGCPAEEAIEHRQINQDVLSVVVLEDGRILVTQADGVGQSADGENAAGFASRYVAENGTANLSQNLEQVGIQIKDAGRNLNPNIADLPDLIARSRAATIEQAGANTTFNQYLLNPGTGRYTALNLGDGYFTIIRQNGALERYNPGDHHSRLTSKGGVQGNPGENGGALNDGDMILIYSDGMGGLTNDEIMEFHKLFLSGNKDGIKQFLDKIPTTLRDKNMDDDRSLFARIHRVKHSN